MISSNYVVHDTLGMLHYKQQSFVLFMTDVRNKCVMPDVRNKYFTKH